jgi:hypothetical protein
MRPYVKRTKAKKDWKCGQMVEPLPSKHVALNSSPSTDPSSQNRIHTQRIYIYNSLFTFIPLELYQNIESSIKR